MGATATAWADCAEHNLPRRAASLEHKLNIQKHSEHAEKPGLQRHLLLRCGFYASALGCMSCAVSTLRVLYSGVEGGTAAIALGLVSVMGSGSSRGDPYTQVCLPPRRTTGCLRAGTSVRDSEPRR